MLQRAFRLCPIVAALTFASPLAAQRAPAPRASLVVLIAVDQLRPDYVERWGSQLDGGLARLHRDAVWFANGRQNHALTETAPGHSTMLSGRWPAHTGIWSNDAGVPDPSTRLLAGATKTGASPSRFNGTALYDWMRARDPETRALSVSRKDRAAILPIGRARVPVFWWSDARFTTSTYYADTLPTWVSEWNARVRPEAWTGRAWQLARAASDYTELDDDPVENAGRDRVFPHKLPTDAAAISDALEKTPWMDSLTLDLAVAGVRATSLGTRAGGTDLLSVSLSSTDAIGHTYGPDSREIHDQIVRLDRMLGAFLDSLATVVPRDRMLVVLTADHGVASMPEYAAAHGRSAGRIDATHIVADVDAALSARWGVPFHLAFDNGLLNADVAALRARGVNVDSLASAIAARIAPLQGVRRTFTPRTLAAASATDDDAGRWRRSLPPSLGWLVAGVAKPGWMFSDGKRAEHGTTQDETVRVPIAFLVPGVAGRIVTRPIDTVDIAPTLAAWLGIAPLERVDGRVVPEVARTVRP